MMTKTQQVLSRQGGPLDDPVVYFGSEDGRTCVAISEDDDNEMGFPEHITVTIQKGDRLN